MNKDYYFSNLNGSTKLIHSMELNYNSTKKKRAPDPPLFSENKNTTLDIGAIDNANKKTIVQTTTIELKANDNQEKSVDYNHRMINHNNFTDKIGISKEENAQKISSYNKGSGSTSNYQINFSEIFIGKQQSPRKFSSMNGYKY